MPYHHCCQGHVGINLNCPFHWSSTNANASPPKRRTSGACRHKGKSARRGGGGATRRRRDRQSRSSSCRWSLMQRIEHSINIIKISDGVKWKNLKINVVGSEINHILWVIFVG
jgi:hypothetical protein